MKPTLKKQIEQIQKGIDYVDSNYTYSELSTALNFMKKEYEINPSENLEQEIKNVELKLKITEKNMMRRNYNCTSGNYPK